ncbi:MAG: substrate-binding domain-containing protein [Granulosicoccus sp.]|nr:substrate-binding domain-containing protein [Granulosicoccus sp.]
MSNTGNRKGTLKRLAAELELSVTTVSRALGGYTDVADATRQRVLDAATRNAYVPNAAGRMLVTGRSGFIGLLLPLRDRARLDPFLGEYIAGLSEALAERGRDLFMATVASRQSELDVLRHVVESGRADGIVLNRIGECDERVDYLVSRGFPFVTHGRTLEAQDRYSWVDTDGATAFADTFRWLYQLGHRRFGLLSITENMTFRRHREEGFRRAVAEQDDPQVSVVATHVPRFDVAARQQAVHTMLADTARPTAILALTDELALCALELASGLGIQVPDQLSVVGFDNIPESAFSTPGLTTFDQCTREAARQLATLLLDSLDSLDSPDGQSGTTHTLITPALVKRGSHAPAPGAPHTVHGTVPANRATTTTRGSYS